MKKHIAFLVIAVAAAVGARGQMSGLHRILDLPLYVDQDRIYNYNQYEKSRWGLGIYYGHTAEDLDRSGEPPAGFFDRLFAGGYVGYGYADKRWKWGLDVAYWTNPSPRRKGNVYASLFHDLTPEAGRTLGRFSLAEFNSSSSFMARLFSDTWRLTAGYSSRIGKNTTANLALRLSDERKLYGSSGLLYPRSDDDWDALQHSCFAEGVLSFAHNNGLSGEMVVGRSNGEWWVDTGFYVRVLLQYQRNFKFKKPFKPFYLNTFAQAGATTDGTPFSRQFNLGGTWGSPLMLGQSMQTARLDEFAANLFALASLRFGFRTPLFDLYNNDFVIGTAPRPFVMAGAMWGLSYGDHMPAPDRGFAEVGAGIDGVVRWGVTDLGVAVAYRLAPANSIYHFDKTSDNLLILFTVSLHV
ncbi:MAG: hypothetical protein IJ745_02050 [Bacteroidales bacterium]|nr:hypothetical protein [Bacteroidales bacterium]